MAGPDQFWTRKQKSDSHDIHNWLVSRNKIGNLGRPRPPMKQLWTLYIDVIPGQQFSYMTPPPGPRRLSPPAPCPQPPLSFFSSPSSPPAACAGPGPPQSNLEDDSGFESLVTNVSDSGDHFLPPINGKLFCQVPCVPASCLHRLTETLACRE